MIEGKKNKQTNKKKEETLSYRAERFLLGTCLTEIYTHWNGTIIKIAKRYLTATARSLQNIVKLKYGSRFKFTPHSPFQQYFRPSNYTL